METVSRNTHEPVLVPWYVTGFVEGEGTFTYNRSGRKVLTLVFGVKLTEKDPRLIALIRDFFGCGHIYDVNPRPPARRASPAKTTSYYKVTRTKDLLAIIQHFDRYPLLGEKKAGYDIWRKMVMLKADHFRNPPWEQLEALAQALSAVAPRNRPSAGLGGARIQRLTMKPSER